MTQIYSTKILLSITTGRLLCKFSDVHECCEFLVEGPIWTHQFAYKPFWQELKHAIVSQHADLAIEAPADICETNYQEWVAEQIKVLGLSREIRSCPELFKTRSDSFTKPIEGKPVIILDMS